jgi:hypothetical protein
MMTGGGFGERTHPLNPLAVRKLCSLGEPILITLPRIDRTFGPVV